MSTSISAVVVMLCDLGVNADIANFTCGLNVWVAGNNNNKPICNAPDASVTDPEVRKQILYYHVPRLSALEMNII